MDRWIAILIIFAAVFAQASDDHQLSREAGIFCSDSWYQYIERTVVTSDNQGHGPDAGSDEWKSVIEFKLGIRDDPNLPNRDSEAWCRHIDQVVRKKVPASSQKNAVSREAVITAGPSYNCDNAAADSIEEMICENAALSAPDRMLSIIYTAAAKKALNGHPPMLKAEQRG